jgi:hypothetical protein
MMLKPLVLVVGIALATRIVCAQDVPGVEVWTMEKKHGAKNKLLAEQRRLSPETDFEKCARQPAKT